MVDRAHDNTLPVPVKEKVQTALEEKESEDPIAVSSATTSHSRRTKMATARSILQAKRAGFVGLGRLGLCTALKFEQAGWDIVGSDVFPAYVDQHQR